MAENVKKREKQEEIGKTGKTKKQRLVKEQSRFILEWGPKKTGNQ